MNSPSEIKNIEKELQENMSQEVRLLRDMLTSIQEEQRAILTCNLCSWERVIEDRLFPAERFQQLNRLILDNIQALCLITNRKLPTNEINHETALELLIEMVNIENCEIMFLKNQIVSLLQEIHQQNHLSAYFLHNHPITHNPNVRDPSFFQAAKKTKSEKKLMLMEPE
jgi:hypothetical protein